MASGVPELFVAAVEMAGRIGFAPHANLKAFQVATGKPWSHELGNWFVAINTDSKPAHGGPAGGMDCDIPPCSVGVWWNGWLAGFVDGGGGCIVAGECANEDSLLTALRAEATDG